MKISWMLNAKEGTIWIIMGISNATRNYSCKAVILSYKMIVVLCPLGQILQMAWYETTRAL